MMVSSKEEIYKKSAQDENSAARMAAIESISIGRETASILSIQGESLKHTEKVLEEHQFLLDRSNRILRGMTWTGWIANTLTPDIKSPTTKSVPIRNIGSSMEKAMQYPIQEKPPRVNIMEYPQDLPTQLQSSAQVMKNFHNNILLLFSCDDINQYDIMMQICCELQLLAEQERQKLESRPHLDLNLNHMQKQLIQEFIQVQDFFNLLKKEYERKNDCKVSFPPSSQAFNPNQHSSNEVDADSKPTFPQNELHQDLHLATLSRSLEELKSIGSAMNETILIQNTNVNSIELQSDSLFHQTKSMIRKSNRMSQRNFRSIRKLKFQSWKVIRHISSNLYLSVMNDKICMSSSFLGDASVFGLWQTIMNTTSLIGFQNKQSKKWMGQSKLFRNAVCSSSSFGNFEQWEIEQESNPSKTALVCASANWGNGGWFVFEEKEQSFRFNKIEKSNETTSTVWSILELP